MSLEFPGRKTAWLTLLFLTIVGVAIVLAPVWIIQPFRPQSQRGVAWSYLLRSWSPLVTSIFSVLALVLVAFLATGARWWRKVVIIASVLPLFGAMWLARQNHFEWMFHPLPNPAYARSTEAGFVADADMVMAIENNGEIVAYPIRLMAYHHLVQDVVGGTPIVATY
jgi:hypothetical protein